MCISDIQITYEDKQICTATEIKLLRLFINNNFSWKIRIECITSKLSSTCYAMRSVKPYVSINTLKMIYYSYFHSVMTYGLLLWRALPQKVQRFSGCKRRLLES